MPINRKFTLENVLKTLLGLFLFLLPWQTIWIYQERFLDGFKWQYGTMGFYATEGLLWATLSLFMIWFLRKWKKERRKKKVELRFSKDRIFLLLCLLFIVYCFISVFWALDADVAFQHSLHILEAFLLFFMLFIGPLRFKQAAAWFVAGATIQSILGIWQFLTQSTFAFKWLGLVSHPVFEAGTSVVSSVDIGRWLRAYGAFSHPNAFGGYLAVSILITSIFYLQTEDRNVWHRSAVRFSFVLQIAALFFTFSRSAWISIVLITLFYWYVVYTRKKYTAHSFSLVALSMMTLVIVGALFFPLLSTRFSGTSMPEVRSTEERIGEYKEAVELLKNNLWTGVGIGNYTVALYELDSARPGWEYQPVHNVFLLLMVELGVVGLLLLASLFTAFCYLHSIFFKLDKIAALLFVLFLLPILLFDHYIFSSFAGLLITAVFWSIFLRIYPTSLRV